MWLCRGMLRRWLEGELRSWWLLLTYSALRETLGHDGLDRGKSMPLRGRAFLPMWFGLAEGYEREFDRWHTIEHMPERLGVPGFLRGRRYKHAHKSERVQRFNFTKGSTLRRSGRRGLPRAPQCADGVV